MEDVKSKVIGRFFRLPNIEAASREEITTITNCCFIKIKELEEMTDRAGYLVLFDLIAGPIDKVLPDATWSVAGARSFLSYTQIYDLSNRPEPRFCKAMRIGEAVLKELDERT